MVPVLLVSRTSKDSRMLRRRGWGRWLYPPTALLSLGAATAGFGAEVEVKVGALIVEVVLEARSLLCAVERRVDWFGIWKDGESGVGPSKREGDGGALIVDASSGAGVTLAALGEAGGVSSLLLALLTFLEGEAGMLRLLLGLANGLDGLSEVSLICDGRRTNGLVFSSESEVDLVGERFDGFVGEVWVGVVARIVDGEAEAVLFWRLKGDCRPDSGEKGRRD